MRKIFTVVAAALFAAACSDTTAPDSSLSATPSYGKSYPQPPNIPEVCSAADTDCVTFTTGDANNSSAASSYGIAGETSTSVAGGRIISSLRGQEQTLAVTGVSLPAATSFDVRYELYIIGAWDGEPKKGPDHVLEWTVQCGTTGTPQRVMYASFGNRLSSATSFPLDVAAKGHFGGQYFNTGLNLTGYPAQFTQKGDVADSKYNVQRTVTLASVCASGELIMKLTAHGIPSNATWAIDNLSVRPL